MKDFEANSKEVWVVFTTKKEQQKYTLPDGKVLTIPVYKPTEFVDLTTGEIISASEAGSRNIWTSTKNTKAVQELQLYYLSQLDTRALELASLVLQYRADDGTMLCNRFDLVDYLVEVTGKRKDNIKRSLAMLVGTIFLSSDLELRSCFKKFGANQLNSVFKKDACMFLTINLKRNQSNTETCE